eukprot:CAMPEP_0170370724 /NCGR_PEP_ID=MMETSP0117_2-20130122/8661_1 /TAXON_ID=400756 /ORGANISM="Durinskia baltica, Strain CSIRO CS-38" /LENGTH=81 /DNA_ID=CAMNT_0010625513 /DNA_START=162 /DNA_END=405 /DNA_ORIENTATION=-
MHRRLGLPRMPSDGHHLRRGCVTVAQPGTRERSSAQLLLAAAAARGGILARAAARAEKGAEVARMAKLALATVRLRAAAPR